MRKVKLTDICHPKQWKTIAKEKFIKEGYPIYGANGIIGYSNIYNHEDRTILITCRGATCGRINVSQPFSYINGNAMCLDDLSSDVFLEYLELFLRNYDFNQIISGSAQPQITIGNLSKIVIPIPEYEKQVQIARIIKSVESIIEANEKLKLLLDQLVSSRFIEMFGDPLTNPNNFEIAEIREACRKIIGGGTPSKHHPEYYDGTIPWVTPKDMKSKKIMDSIDHISVDAVNNSSAKNVPRNSVLMVIRSGILKHTLPVAVNDVEVTINQDMKAFIPSEKILPLFLCNYFKMIEKDVLSGVRGVTADNIDFKEFQKRKIIIPPVKLQEEFSHFYELIDKSKY